MSNAKADWLSVHVQTTFPIYSEDFDPLISDLAVSVIGDLDRQGHQHEWFVVRYASDGYPHLRLRIRRSRGLTQQLVEQCLTYHGERLNKRNPGSVVAHHWIPYEPEVQRYGGPHALPDCETFFCHSSKMAAQVLPTLNRRTRGVRLGRAALATLALVAMFHDTPKAVAEWLARYSNGMSLGSAVVLPRNTQFSPRYLVEALRRLQHGVSLGSGLDCYVEASADLRTKCLRLVSVGNLQPSQYGGYGLWSLLSGQVHMTFNRLGVSREEESIIAAYVARLLLEDVTP